MKREDFIRLTALHPVFDKMTWERRVIREQATAIRNLRAERDQQRRGYLRKIARLERALDAARAERPPAPMGETADLIEALRKATDPKDARRLMVDAADALEALSRAKEDQDLVGFRVETRAPSREPRDVTATPSEGGE